MSVLGRNLLIAGIVAVSALTGGAPGMSSDTAQAYNRISCNTAAWLVRRHRVRIRSRDCGRWFHRFYGVRGKAVMVRVSAYNGRVRFFFGRRRGRRSSG